jgi:hypothetical protein
MIEIEAAGADNVLAFSAHGTVSAEDYERVIIPAVEDKLRTHHKIRLLYQLGADFKGYAPLAIWDDAKLGVRHLTAFEKIAIVSDVPWVIHAMKFFGLFVPCPVKVFSVDSLGEARIWARG